MSFIWNALGKLSERISQGNVPQKIYQDLKKFHREIKKKLDIMAREVNIVEFNDSPLINRTDDFLKKIYRNQTLGNYGAAQTSFKLFRLPSDAPIEEIIPENYLIFDWIGSLGADLGIYADYELPAEQVLKEIHINELLDRIEELQVLLAFHDLYLLGVNLINQVSSMENGDQYLRLITLPVSESDIKNTVGYPRIEEILKTEFEIYEGNSNLKLEALPSILTNLYRFVIFDRLDESLTEFIPFLQEMYLNLYDHFSQYELFKPELKTYKQLISSYQQNISEIETIIDEFVEGEKKLGENVFQKYLGNLQEGQKLLLNSLLDQDRIEFQDNYDRLNELLEQSQTEDLRSIIRRWVDLNDDLTILKGSQSRIFLNEFDDDSTRLRPLAILKLYQNVDKQLIEIRNLIIKATQYDVATSDKQSLNYREMMSSVHTKLNNLENQIEKLNRDAIYISFIGRISPPNGASGIVDISDYINAGLNRDSLIKITEMLRDYGYTSVKLVDSEGRSTPNGQFLKFGERDKDKITKRLFDDEIGWRLWVVYLVFSTYNKQNIWALDLPSRTSKHLSMLVSKSEDITIYLRFRNEKGMKVDSVAQLLTLMNEVKGEAPKTIDMKVKAEENIYDKINLAFSDTENVTIEVSGQFLDFLANLGNNSQSKSTVVCFTPYFTELQSSNVPKESFDYIAKTINEANEVDYHYKIIPNFLFVSIPNRLLEVYNYLLIEMNTINQNLEEN